MRGVSEGPGQLVKTSGYAGSMAVSTLKHMLATNRLRRGDDKYCTPPSRLKERVFGGAGTGRSTRISAGQSKAKREMNYDPRADSVLDAYIRLLAKQVPK